MAEKAVPTGLGLTPLDETFRQDPYPVLQELRQREPVHHDQDLQRYFFTGYDDVKSILRHPDYWSDPHKSREGSFARFLIRGEDEEVSMLLADEPEHKRLRKLVNDIFTPKAVRVWHERITQVIDSHLDNITGPEFDLIADYAGPPDDPEARREHVGRLVAPYVAFAVFVGERCEVSARAAQQSGLSEECTRAFPELGIRRPTGRAPSSGISGRSPPTWQS